MTNDTIIQTDFPLNEEQKSTLDALLNLIIPASDDGTMPSAAEVGFLEYLVNAEPDFLPKLKQSLDAIIDGAKPAHDKPFFELGTSDQEDLVNALRSTQGELFHLLTNQVMSCYYQNDKVMTRIGLEARPPFPKGNHVDNGDLSLLEPVKQRGKVWRKV